MNRKQCEAALIAAFGLLTACGSGGKGHDSSGKGDGDDGHRGEKDAQVSGKPSELPLPAVPPEYDTPEKRVKYVLSVYWDGLDFSDHRLSLDTAFMEQSFSNFISLCAYEQNAGPAMEHLVEHASADTLATLFVWDIADKYLNDPNSPMRSGELYRAFLLALRKSAVLTGEYRDKLEYQAKIAELNRPGTVANDLRFVTREGKNSSLLKHCEGKLTMLIFYDPGCESCKGVMADLSRTELPKGLNVLAIDAEEDRPLWESTAGSLPSGWTVGYATDKVQEKMLYHLPATPVVYLLDPQGRVLLKDPTVATALGTAATILADGHL